MRNQYDLKPEFWQENRNIQIAKKYGVVESSVSRKRNNLIKKFGDEYKCQVLGWFGWKSVDWSLSDQQIQKNWRGKKTPNLLTIKKWRQALQSEEKIKIN